MQSNHVNISATVYSNKQQYFVLLSFSKEWQDQHTHLTGYKHFIPSLIKQIAISCQINFTCSKIARISTSAWQQASLNTVTKWRSGFRIWHDFRGGPELDLSQDSHEKRPPHFSRGSWIFSNIFLLPYKHVYTKQSCKWMIYYCFFIFSSVSALLHYLFLYCLNLKGSGVANAPFFGSANPHCWK